MAVSSGLLPGYYLMACGLELHEDKHTRWVWDPRKVTCKNCKKLRKLF